MKTCRVPGCEHRANRPRGLCWHHYYAPGVRDQFPSASKFARRGSGAGRMVAPLPPTPTAALPRSPDKLAVLQARAAAGLTLWHPDDAPLPEAASVPQERGNGRRGRHGARVATVRLPAIHKHHRPQGRKEAA